MSERFLIQKSDSRLEVRTGTEGLLSGWAHEHLIRAKDFEGFIDFSKSEPHKSRVSMSLLTQGLELMDEKVKPKDRKEIMKNMRKILECTRFPSISYLSESVTPVADGLELEGNLRIKGRSKLLRTFVSIESDEDSLTATGNFSFLHSDFGMKPFRAALGAIKVANELSIDFHVRAVRTK